VSTDLDAVLEANRAFYDAFEQRDLDAMSDVWEHSERIVCTHPGWAALRGWGSVAGSWFALFTGPSPIQFILTDVHADVAGEVAWVTLDENVIGERIGGTVSAVNVFARGDDERWRLVVHHGSPVASSQ